MTTKIPFERAIQQHGPTVLRVCSAVLGQGADAEDATSETFLAALRSWPDLADDTNIEAWLVRVAQRKAVDVTRARARNAVPSAELSSAQLSGAELTGAELPDPGPNTEIWSAVGDLPERQRLAVAYHYLGGLPHTETAELIGGTPAAVRRAAADGIKTLRRTLTTGDTT